MKLAEDMQNNGVARDVWTYASLIAACQSCGNRWKDALAFYQDMQDKGRPPVAACKGRAVQIHWSQVIPATSDLRRNSCLLRMWSPYTS